MGPSENCADASFDPLEFAPFLILEWTARVRSGAGACAGFQRGPVAWRGFWRFFAFLLALFCIPFGADWFKGFGATVMR